MIHKITFNLTWINGMGNGRLSTYYDQVRYQSIIEYPKTSGRVNLSLLMQSQTSAQQNQENMNIYMHAYT